jgi:DNA replication protein DnaC
MNPIDPTALTPTQKHLSARGVPGQLLGINLDRIPEAIPEEYRLIAKELRSLIRNPRLIFLAGPKQRGKTALAAGMMREFFENGKPSVFMVPAADLSRDPRKTANELPSKFYQADLLVIDDMQGRDRSVEPLIFALLETRYSRGQATIVISSMDPSAIAEDMGDDRARRMLHISNFTKCEWPSLR